MPSDILQEIGSYAGLAAVVGLAVLSALYFSQARDVKRLREWAGRAPERSLEQPGVPPATPAGRVVAQPQQQQTPLPAARPIPVPGGAQAATASATGLRPATAAGAAGVGQETQEHEALEPGTGDEEAVGVGAETGEHDAASSDGTGEHEVAAQDDAAAGDTGDEEAVEGDEEFDPNREVDDDDDFDEDEDEDLAEEDEDESLAPPEGEPAVAANGDEEQAEETGDREPVGAQALTDQRVAAQSGLAAPPATAAGGMAAGSASTQGPARTAPPPLPPRPMPARPGPAPTGGQRPPGMPPGGARPSQTAIIPPPSRAPWYRTPRYLVLAIAGVLIVGGGAAFGVVQLTKDDTTASTGGSGQAGQSQPAGGDDSGGGSGGGNESKAVAVDPKKVTVAVLNGTTVPGLAAQIGDKLGNFGFQLGNITNSTDQDQGRAESAVLYAPGHQREGLAVSRKLRIGQREQIDAQTQSVAGDATVVVIAGIDQTR